MIKLSEKLLAAVNWHAVGLDLSPQYGDCYATHKGSLKVSAFEIKCYKASDGLAALDVEDIERFFRGCPNCDAPSDCRHCNQVANAAEGHRAAIKLESEV